MAKLLTVQEIADLIQVAPVTIQLWTREGIIPSIRVNPKIVRYQEDAVIAALLRLSDQRSIVQ